MKKAIQSVYPALAAMLLVLLACTLGCSYQSVHHLERQSWAENSRRTLGMNYLTFTYTCGQQESSLSVKGRAYPKLDKIPEWAEWIDDIWLGTYLSDKDGRVLAKALRILSPQALKADQGIPFEFTLTPHDMGSPGPVFISFGYRLVLTAQEPSKTMGEEQPTDKKQVFFASESALTRF